MRASAQDPLPYRTAPEVLWVGPQALTLPPRIATRQRALELSLATLSAGSEGRVVSGAVQVALGASFIAVGAFVQSEVARSLLILLGAGSLARGTIQLTLAPAAEQPSRDYAAMPMATGEQVRARIRFGEQQLEQLALAARRTRIVDGSVTMLVATSYVPLLWWLERREQSSYRFGDSAFDYVGLAISVINFGSGLVTALVRSEAEKRADAYRELKQRTEREAPGELEQLAARTSLRFHVDAATVRAVASLSF